MGSSKKKRTHRDDLDHHDPIDTPKPKLPTIKLSLRLPAHNPTGLSSSSSLSAPPTSTSSSAARKRRASQHDASDNDVDNEDDDDLDIGSPRSSSSHHYRHHHSHYDEDIATVHKKKKKHKHKHKHKHSKHKHSHHERMTGEDDVESDEDQHVEVQEEADKVVGDDYGSAEVKSPPPTKLKIRLGSHSSSSNSSKKHAHAASTTNPASFADQASRKEHSRSRSLSTTQTPLVHVKQEEDASSITPYQYEASHTAPSNTATATFNEEGASRLVYGQKKPFSATAQQQQHSEAHSGPDDDEEDVLGGDLEDPEEDHEMGEGEGVSENDNDNGYDDEDDDDTLMSPISDRSRAGSRSLGGSGVATPTTSTTASSATTTAAGKMTKKAIQAKVPTKGGDGDAIAASAGRSSRGGKRSRTASKRQSTPKLQTSAPPKRKNIAQICHKLLDGLFRKDHYSLFSAPVDVQQVPDYAHIIKHPMDLSTMRSKVDRGFYPKLDLFLEDFKLICDNCKVYNAPDTLYYKQAQKLWEWGSKVIEKERKAIQDIEEELAKLQIPVKEEETLDVDGLGDQQQMNQHPYQLLQQQQSQQQPQHGSYSRNPIMSFDEPLDSPTPTAMDSNSSIRTPQQYRRSKRVKYKRDGTIQLSYSTDGSIDPNSHPDPWSLVPLGREFGAAPMVTPIYDFRTGGGVNGMHHSSQSRPSTPMASTSSLSFSSAGNPTFQSYLDDYPYFRMPEVSFIPATFLDYGMFPMAGALSQDTSSTMQMQQPSSSLQQKQSSPTNIPAYTGMIFGDDTGEAYVRSLASFLEGIVDSKEMETLTEDEKEGLLRVKEIVVDKVARLTHGSSLIAEQVAQVLRKKNEQKLAKKAEEGDAMDVDSVNQVKDDNDEEMGISSPDNVSLLDVRPYKFGSMDGASAVTQLPEKEPQQSQGQPDVEVKEEIKTEDGHETKEESKDKKADTTGLINVEQLIHDLELWPDFEAWRRFKLELDCLVPPSTETSKVSRGADADSGQSMAKDAEKDETKDDKEATSTVNVDKETDSAEKDDKAKKEKEEDLKVLWGLSWPTISDPEEAEKKKKWVREYLEQNSDDFREVLRILTRHQRHKTLSSTSTKASSTSTPSTATVTPAAPTASSSTSALTAYLKDLQDDERETVKRNIANIRRRLIKMAQYVPLSQINPDKLPPPPPTPAPSTAGITPATASNDVAAKSTTSSTPVSAPTHTPTSTTASASTSAAASPSTSTRTKS
ncbi:hypothetical protein BGW42_003334 [Actinomortierella wolfii]|nr:hypothetical protein BGW42_003334 [Actinomortierella wolfii]